LLRHEDCLPENNVTDGYRAVTGRTTVARHRETDGSVILVGTGHENERSIGGRSPIAAPRIVYEDCRGSSATKKRETARRDGEVGAVLLRN